MVEQFLVGSVSSLGVDGVRPSKVVSCSSILCGKEGADVA